MSKTRKLMGLAAALAFAMVMLPASAFADTTQYDLFVNGEQFTSEKLTIECGEGTATYDPATQTLALNSASITNAADYGGINSKLTGDLAITLQGSNYITLTTIWASRPWGTSKFRARAASQLMLREKPWTA